MPYLLGEVTTAPHDDLYWATTASRYATRIEDWKLVFDADGKTWLFDLATDIAERVNLAADYPEIVDDLTQSLEEWVSQLAEPLWPVP